MKTLRRLSASALLLVGGAILLAQQQAAEAPATDRRVQTRPAVAGLHGLVTTGHPIASSAGLQIKVQIENRVPAETIAALRAMGHKIEVLPGWGSLGHMQAIRVDLITGAMMAGGDPRRTAYAMGY